MVEYGLDEESVTLTFINGIGGQLARRLCDSGVMNIEELAQADAPDLARLRGISEARADSWIDEATRRLPLQSALILLEVGEKANASSQRLDSAVDPYRLRRALELRVSQDTPRTLTVTGGLEPHRVRLIGRHLRCDCGDFGAGNTCKHVLAVRLQQGDRVLDELVERILSEPDGGPLDLFMLWYGKGESAWRTPTAAI
jgi:helicase